MDITNLTSMDIADNNNKVPSVLGRQTKWEDLFFYQKADVIYQLSFVFCDRFIHLYKDRTRDQVIQAARSCKQNIVEGLADGVTSSEMQLKLLNVARASLKELREDFEDYLKSRHREFYVAGEERYDVMLDYCSRHNKLKDYEPFFQTWSDEQMCNYALTLCHMIDRRPYDDVFPEKAGKGVCDGRRHQRTYVQGTYRLQTAAGRSPQTTGG